MEAEPTGAVEAGGPPRGPSPSIPPSGVASPSHPPSAPTGRGLIFEDPQEPDERRRRRRHRDDPAIVRVNRHRAVRLRPAWRRMATALLLVVLALLLVVGVVIWYVAPDPAGWVGDRIGEWTQALRDWVFGLLAIREV